MSSREHDNSALSNWVKDAQARTKHLRDHAGPNDRAGGLDAGVGFDTEGSACPDLNAYQKVADGQEYVQITMSHSKSNNRERPFLGQRPSWQGFSLMNRFLKRLGIPVLAYNLIQVVPFEKFDEGTLNTISWTSAEITEELDRKIDGRYSQRELFARMVDLKGSFHVICGSWAKQAFEECGLADRENVVFVPHPSAKGHKEAFIAKVAFPLMRETGFTNHQKLSVIGEAIMFAANRNEILDAQSDSSATTVASESSTGLNGREKKRNRR